MEGFIFIYSVFIISMVILILFIDYEVDVINVSVIKLNVLFKNNDKGLKVNFSGKYKFFSFKKLRLYDLDTDNLGNYWYYDKDI